MKKTGTDADDTIAGTNSADILVGNGGNDRLDGKGGSDQLFGNIGDDTLVGGAGKDSLYGGADNDHLFGGDANDTLDGGANNDRLFGGDGDDKLMGGSGNDTLRGGFGDDILEGGTGRDVFQFDTDDRFGHNNPTIDKIMDFEIGKDKIDLSLIDANSTIKGNQAFDFVEYQKGAPLAAGEVGAYYDMASDTTHVVGAVDGDGLVDYVVDLPGEVKLTASDFNL